MLRRRWFTKELASMCAAGALALTVATPKSEATEVIDSAFSLCTDINCTTTSMAGFMATYYANSQTPWVAKFLIVQGNCFRFDTSFVAAGSLKAVVIAPNGTTAYRSDTGGTGGAGAPLVKIDPAPSTGYYTVVLTSADGGPLNTDFHILFGQYDSGNPNCAVPTTPVP